MFQIIFKKLIAYAHRAGIQDALALDKRNEVRSDGLILTNVAHQLDIGWRARDIHAWDRERGCSPEEVERLFKEQCFSDTEAAICRLFSALPLIDEIQFRVVRPDSDDELLAGRVARPSLSRVSTGVSPRGKLWQMGINVCVIGFCLLLWLLGVTTNQCRNPSGSKNAAGQTVPRESLLQGFVTDRNVEELKHPKPARGNKSSFL
jgi:hypothetical protein